MESERAKQQGVVFLGDVGVVSCAISDSSQLCGGRTVVSQMPNDPRKMLFSLWVPRQDGKGFRLTPFSMVRGKHSPASGLKFHPQTGKLVAMGADFQAMAAIFHWLHLSRTASVDGKWHGLRSKIGSMHMNPEDIDKATYVGIRVAQEKTWGDVFIGRKKRGREEGGCGSPMHKRYRRVGKLVPLSVEYCESQMCVPCLRHTVLKTQPELQANQTAVMTRASTGKEILARCTTGSRPLLRSLFNYSLDKLVASVDKLHFADPDQITLHAVAITYYWMYFQHIYADRPTSYAICQAEFLKGARRAALCKTTPCSGALRTAAVYVQNNVHALSSFGRAPCECLQRGEETIANRKKRWFNPWLHHTRDMRTIHHRHELLVKDKCAYTRSFVQVLSAIASGMLVLCIHLTPYAKLPHTEKLRVSVRSWQVLCSGKAKETAFRNHPDEWTDGEFVNYEWLASLLWKNRMACYDHGIEPVPVNVNLFGSLTKAIVGCTDKFGPTNVKSGETFIELVGLGLQSFNAVEIKESCYSDTLLYAGVPNAAAVADSMRTERVMIKKGGGIERICERIHKNLGIVQGVDPAELTWPEIKITSAMHDEFQSFIWPNETPDGGIGLDTETLAAAKVVAGNP
jgi:hypothetical protein